MPAPVTSEIASTDGATVVAHDHGGSGEPVILCHATGMHGRYWDAVCARLASAYRCIALDLRGHGDARPPTDLNMAWTGMADDVMAVLDHFALTRVRMVGHSMGGCAALMTELCRPGTVVAAWLFEPIVIPDDSPAFAREGENPLAAGARKRREVFESRDAAFERYASRPPFADVDLGVLRSYVDHGFADQPDGTVRLKCRGEVEARVFDNSRTDVFERLGAVEAPVVVAGSGDGDGPAAIAPEVADRLPNGRYEAWPDLTHFGPMQDPDRIAAAIRAALQVTS